MSQMLFLNPHKRGTKKRRSKAKTKAKRKSVRTLFANPAAPKRRKKRRASTVASRSKRRLRRNPIRIPKKAKPGTVIKEQLIPAVHGAMGAIALSAANGMIIDKLPIDEKYKTGPMRDVLKGVSAVGIAVIASKAVNNAMAKNIAVGAMTMVMTDAARRLMLTHAPAVKLAGLEDELFSPMNGMGSLGYWTQPASTPALGFDNSGGNLSMYTEPVADTASAYDPMLGEYDYGSGFNY